MSRMEELLHYPLSNDDLTRLYPGNIEIYNNLGKYISLNNILKNDVCYILFQTKAHNYGHWCCIIKHGNRIEFFDPQGYYIENQKKYVNDEFFNPTNYIAQLLKDSPYDDIHYNEYAFQNPDYATCGRWCALRAMFKHLTLEEFKDKIINLCDKYKLKPDELAILLTHHDILLKDDKFYLL